MVQCPSSAQGVLEAWPCVWGGWGHHPAVLDQSLMFHYPVSKITVQFGVVF